MKKTMFIIVVILIAVDIYSISCILHFQTKIEMLAQSNGNYITMYKTICNDLLSTNYSENYSLNPNLLLKSESGDMIKLGNLINKENMLVVYHSQLNCDACVEFQINMVKEYLDKIGKYNILFITAYSNLRNLLLFNKIYSMGCPIYAIEDNTLQIPIEEENEPFFFEIDKNMRTNQVFIPRREIPDLTKKYLGMMSKRYFGAKEK
jgi:hypothetical protein